MRALAGASLHLQHMITAGLLLLPEAAGSLADCDGALYGRLPVAITGLGCETGADVAD